MKYIPIKICEECDEPVMDHVISGEKVPPRLWHAAFDGHRTTTVVAVGAQKFDIDAAVPSKPSEMDLILPSAGLIPLRRWRSG